MLLRSHHRRLLRFPRLASSYLLQPAAAAPGTSPSRAHSHPLRTWSSPTPSSPPRPLVSFHPLRMSSSPPPPSPPPVVVGRFLERDNKVLLCRRNVQPSFGFRAPILQSRNIHFSALLSKASSNSSEVLSYMGDLDSEQKELVKKLVNFRMIDGKRTRVRGIVYQTFHRLARLSSDEKNPHDVAKLMADAVENVKPVCEVVKVGRAGTVYDVPGIVSKERQRTLAIRWIFGGALKRRVNYRVSLEKCLFAEILDAYRKKGNACKRRETLHGLASANRSFAHFRWW